MTLEKQIQQLKTDNTSGSSVVLKRTLELVKNELAGGKTGPDQIKTALFDLQSHFNAFAALRHFIMELSVHMSDAEQSLQFVRDYEETWRNVNQRCAVNFLNHIDATGATILVHSSSGTVVEIFQRMAMQDQKAYVIQTESRPAYEGRKQAETLASLGHDVTLIADMAFSRYLAKTDWALLGADAVYADGFVNKTGSYSIALAAFHNSVPVFVAADSRKMQRSSGNLNEPPKPPDEVSRDLPEGVSVENYYFELTPGAFVRYYVTENELLTPDLQAVRF